MQSILLFICSECTIPYIVNPYAMPRSLACVQAIELTIKQPNLAAVLALFWHERYEWIESGLSRSLAVVKTHDIWWLLNSNHFSSPFIDCVCFSPLQATCLQIADSMSLQATFIPCLLPPSSKKFVCLSVRLSNCPTILKLCQCCTQ